MFFGRGVEWGLFSGDVSFFCRLSECFRKMMKGEEDGGGKKRAGVGKVGRDHLCQTPFLCATIKKKSEATANKLKVF